MFSSSSDFSLNNSAIFYIYTVYICACDEITIRPGKYMADLE